MEPAEVLKKLEEVRAGTLDQLARLSQAQLDARPPKTGGEEAWSLGEVFMHIASDEIYLRELLSRPLRDGVKPPDGVTYLPPPPNYGTAKPVIEFWLRRARAQTRDYVKEWPSTWDADLRHEGGLSPMNALEWLDGYGGHEAFHHRQIDDLIAWCIEVGVS
jgi:hypothetical protein